MSRSTSERCSAICLWTMAMATCLVGVVVVLGLGTVVPVVMDSSVAGMSARLAVCATCMAAFRHSTSTRVMTSDR